MIDKRNNLCRGCGRKKESDILLTELKKVCNETVTKTEADRKGYLQSRIGDALDNKKNMWKELRHLGLLPGTEDALHGFSLDELNAHFAGVSVSPLEDIEDAASIFEEAGAGGFAFRPVGLGDVELAVKHFSSQA